jgi:hypothetical protein
MDGDDGGMTAQSTSRLLVVLSIAYGIVIAILGALGSSAIALVAMIGALIIGGLWAVRGIYFGGARRSGGDGTPR